MDKVKFDDIAALIRDGKIYYDFASAPLVDHEKARLFPNPAIADLFFRTIPDAESPVAAQSHAVKKETGEILSWDGNCFQIMNVGLTQVTLLSADKTAIPLDNDNFNSLVKQGAIVGLNVKTDSQIMLKIQEKLASANPKDIEMMLKRIKIFNGEIKASRSTRRSLNALYRKGEIEFGNGNIGFLTHSARGNRSHRLDIEDYEMMDKVIKGEYENIIRKGKMVAYGALEKLYEEKKRRCPSFSTFCDYINRKLTVHEQTETREGTSAGYQVSDFTY